LSVILKGGLTQLSLNNHKHISTLFGVSELPIPYIERKADITELRNNLLAKNKEIILAISNAPDTGKSVLARALALDEEVRRAFHDGVVWLEFGPDPNLTELQSQLVKALDGSLQLFKNTEDGQDYLNSQLAKRDCLIILDDVREFLHIEEFIPLNTYQILITTRIPSPNTAINIHTYEFTPLKEYQCRRLLEQSADLSASTLPSIADWVVREYANSPGTLIKIGRMVREGFISWEELDKVNQAHLLSLFVFPVNVAIPDDVIRMYWSSKRLDNEFIDNMMNRLTELSIMQTVDKHHIVLQNLSHDYFSSQIPEKISQILPAVGVSDSQGIYFSSNSNLLEAYARVHLEGGIPKFGEDYFLTYLPYHLKSAGKYTELRNLLFNFNWMRKRLELNRIDDIINDYNIIPSDLELQIILSTLRLSMHILKYDKKQLASQLIGRLNGQKSSSIQYLLRQALKQQELPWLRPLEATLNRPGGALHLTLEGHTGAVKTVAIIPNGRNIISGSDDRTLRIWDWTSGTSKKPLKDHRNWVQAVITTPDGQQVVSGSTDGTIKVWNLETETLEYTLGPYDVAKDIDATSTDHQNEIQDISTERQSGVQAVVMTPDGRRIVSGMTDGRLIVWDVASRTPEYTLKEHIAGIEAIIMMQDGQKFVSASRDFTIKLWNFTQKESERSWDSDTFIVKTLTITPDNQYLISGSTDGIIRIWDMTAETKDTIDKPKYKILTSKDTYDGHVNSVISISITPDGRHLLSGSTDGSIKVWDWRNERLDATLEGHLGPVTSIATFADNRYFISASSDHTLKIWDLTNRTNGNTGVREDRVGAVVINSNGESVIGAEDNGKLKLWNLETRTFEKYLLKAHNDRVVAMSTTDDGCLMVSGGIDGTLNVWNLMNENVIYKTDGYKYELRTVAITSDGLRVVFALKNGTLKVWNLADGRIEHTLRGHKGPVNGVVISRNGQRVVSSSTDNTLKVWDLVNGRIEHTFKGHEGAVNGVVISRDGQQVVSCSDDCTLKVWNLATKSIKFTLVGHQASIQSITMTPDGHYILSASLDKSLKVWDLETCTNIASFNGDHPFQSCAVAPDGVTFVATDSEGHMHFVKLEL
jgi:WD40 repeat protein